MISENELWMLSFYRMSEISGSLFFGRLARSMKAGPIQNDMTKHFADEAQHAYLWTSCLEKLDVKPIRIKSAYQDQYLEAAGMPVNLMEVLAITQIFERRVISQYAVHSQVEGLDPLIRETLMRIMEDEKWHIEWIRKALHDMEKQYGRDLVETTVERFRKADREVYKQTLAEHGERINDILRANVRVA